MRIDSAALDPLISFTRSRSSTVATGASLDMALEKPSRSSGSPSRTSDQGSSRASTELTQEERERVSELISIDRKVRAHEQAHASVGGRYASAPRYDFERGPDGLAYAVGGEVRIDSSPVANDPEATLIKMDIVQRAALAPVDPSAEDRQVAARAAGYAAEARVELARLRLEEANGGRSAVAASSSGAASTSGDLRLYARISQTEQAPALLDTRA
ncbi:putative metalloprotease CJM1_0395 family protein [Metapseudomonas otitidis]|uniref:putative metalloprotease CJM1_0395 family protein n=1 Tax=Metapseudomonas otitidis TaxID=319939 RepID=UPI0013F65222|nr:putative metalloprotease CJM1_0395 family protein [Pseudomonas otitidis]